MSNYFVIMKFEGLAAGIIFLLLLLKIGRGLSNDLLLAGIQEYLLGMLVLGFFFNREGYLFGDGFYQSPLIAVQKNILVAGTYLITLLCSEWLRKSPQLPEFLILMFSALLGMFLLISSRNFLMFYLSLELAGIPVAAMANFDLDKRISSEAAMKMILSAAFSSGILLFGISVIYGVSGSISFSAIPPMLTSGPLTIFAFILFFSALAFKLSVVPFHLWTADVYEGSPIATTAFLSVISKGSVAFVLVIALYAVFRPLQEVWYHVLAILSVATMLIGNLFAMRQENFKRFLAFSSIAQVGFILVAMSAGTKSGQTAITYFMLVYIFSNLAAFGVVAAVAARTGSEQLSAYKCFYRNNPFLSWVLALAMFSLAGIPPMAGFFGKFFLLGAGAGTGNFWLILVAALNMIISLYYYLRVVRMVFMEKNESPMEAIRLSGQEKLGLLICCGGILLAGLSSWIYEYLNELGR